MRVLGIETTCDETAVAVVADRLGGDGGEILSNEVMSQIAQHAAYGGVVPEIAARAHIDVLDRLIAARARECRTDIADVDAIAAAAGPGLIGGILVGLTAAKALALAAGKPFIAVNHLEAHALTARLTDGIDFPYLALLVSGGHTQLVAVRGVGDYQRLGSTVDDAAGEAFDKVAQNAGAALSRRPADRDAGAGRRPASLRFPTSHVRPPSADFSLSGLKTAVRQEIIRLGARRAQTAKDLAASFQAAIVDVIVDRVRAGLRLFAERGRAADGLVIGGGVGANGAIRRALTRLCAEAGLRFVSPPPELCSDNGAMIAWAGLERFTRGLTDDLDFAAASALAARRPPARAPPRQGVTACVALLVAASRALALAPQRRRPGCWRRSRSSQGVRVFLRRRAPDSRAVDARLIDGAKTSIDMAAYVLTDRALVAALGPRAMRGVHVRVYLDGEETGRGERVAHIASAPNVELRRKGSLARSRCISNPIRSTARVLRSGSANFSVSGEAFQDNDLIVIDSPVAAGSFTDTFERLWARADNQRIGGR